MAGGRQGCEKCMGRHRAKAALAGESFRIQRDAATIGRWLGPQAAVPHKS
jgi:hypothetical protein